MRTSAFLFLLFAVPTMFATDNPCEHRVKFDVEIMSQISVLPTAPMDKALLYVLRDKGAIYNIGMAVDGKWVGATRKNTTNYFFVILEPGEHSLCVTGAWGSSRISPGFMKLTVEAGKTYYVEQQWIDIDFKSSRFDLQSMDDLQGSMLLKRSKLAVLRAIHFE